MSDYQLTIWSAVAEEQGLSHRASNLEARIQEFNDLIVDNELTLGPTGPLVL